jgi:hypothetical protein
MAGHLKHRKQRKIESSQVAVLALYPSKKKEVFLLNVSHSNERELAAQETYRGCKCTRN